MTGPGRSVEPLMDARTKLICTLGPATAGVERIAALAEAGADVFRVNFSHGTAADHAAAVSDVREVEGRLDRALAVLADLPGPKVRLGRLAAGSVELRAGDRFELRPGGEPGDASGAPVTYAGLPRDVEPGDRILLADGAVELVARESGDVLVTEVVGGGTVRSGAGVNVPAERLGLPGITDRDREGLARALDLEVDFVAQSFVRGPGDVSELRELMGERRRPIVAKLETRPAVDSLRGIVAEADAIMVARGDLGVELPLEEIPLIQKEMIMGARRGGIPVVVATQMLESMQHSPRPTRAEASDVANAVLDGADAVMLSAETAVGEFPVEAAAAATRICWTAERRRGMFSMPPPDCRHQDQAGAITHAAAEVVASHPEVAAIASFTRTGRTAELLSIERPGVPIYAFAPDARVRHQVCLR
ncbi:MAG: pyruvate kinase [Actinobacteria bacterium]|nr:pyruvate kinase [Actinomycetota bacterium]